MSDKTQTNLSLGDIALCLSGGGYRAAAFHLGSLTMLDRLGLVDNVKYFSTASGGTIVAMKYVVDRLRGVEFKKFADGFRQFLGQCNAVDDALKVLTTTACPAGTDDISLIRAASSIYRKRLSLDGLTVKWLTDTIKRGQNFHDLIFNSTEFHTGNGFRFRIKRVGTSTFGNKNVTVKNDVRDQIDLADVIAASSCFPGAFEPMRFPQDFVLTDRAAAVEPFTGAGKGMTSVALMDGGIFDNQGLDEMMSGYSDKEALPFDVVLVSDTTQWADTLLEYELPKRPGRILVVRYVLYVFVLSLFSVLTASLFLAALVIKDASSAPPLQTLVTSISASFSILLPFILLLLLGLGHDKLLGLPLSGYVFPIWERIKDLRLGDLKTLIKSRADSAKVMTFNVFMKRIRAQTMDKVLGDVYHTSRKNILEGNIAFGEIYGIERSQIRNNQIFVRDPELIPTPRMKDISKRASAVATALWLQRSEVEDLVNCGRITTCYALLDLIWKRRNRDARDAALTSNPVPAEPTDPLSPFNSDYVTLKAAWSDLKTEFP